MRREWASKQIVKKNPFPDITTVMKPQMFVSMKYTTQVSLDVPITQGADSHIFRANSIFDPDQSGGGHIPYGSDIWSTFYNHYCVVGAKMTVTISREPGNSNGGTFLFGIVVDDDTSLSDNSVGTFGESGRFTYRTMNDSNDAWAGRKLHLTKYFSAKKFFNCKNAMDRLPTLGASFGSNPIEEAFFHLVMRSGSNSVIASGTAVYDCLVTIDYVVGLSERKLYPSAD